MLIAISRHKRHKKTKSPDAINRSTFLKMLFGFVSGDFGSSLMKNYVAGDTKFIEQWRSVNEHVLKAFTPAKEDEHSEKSNDSQK